VDIKFETTDGYTRFMYSPFLTWGERGGEGEGERLSTEAKKGCIRRIWYERAGDRESAKKIRNTDADGFDITSHLWGNKS
jgi:hypothetical protein